MEGRTVSARIALEVAYRSGLSIAVRDGRLSLRADAPPPATVLDLIKAHRAEILAILADETDAKPVRRTQTGDSRTQNTDANDAHVALWVDWNERAAVLEYDGGLERPQAERRAQAQLSNTTGAR